MTTALGRGECGGHLTLIFTVEDSNEDPYFQGSRGAGICLVDGVEAIARGEDGEGKLIVNGINSDFDDSLYQDILEELSKEIPEIREYDWELSIRMSLPPSQGFGMSASGAIASAVSIQRAIGVPHEECQRRSLMLAHLVERKRSSGLGDTTALSSGGVERRIVPGSPFSGDLLDHGPGKADSWGASFPVLLSWKEQTGTHTSGYIDRPDWKNKISKAGEVAMDSLGFGDWNMGRWSELIDESKLFSLNSGLTEDSGRSELLDTIDKVILKEGLSDTVTPLLCMLGESVVIVPIDPQNEEDWLSLLIPNLEQKDLSIFASRVGNLN
ncbi:MAG: hypothetical protein CMA12_04140 [Euryarchaeota archaeon]|nr:hypothetical protein [Euryarchaeota archaeon]OUW22345.1 MAG: hypothetical protein CBD33_02485 [Euryarchaeota archaeon TMED173]|tara:strand:- start:1502 stop:2479 length:978 start_codon:yes stop_codon:yes gene_type:complete